MNRRLILATCLAAFAAASLACRGHDLRPRLVPGTEHLEPGGNEAWFTISPDEKWLAFFNVDSTSSFYERFHLVTMNMGSGAKTDHRLDEIPTTTFDAMLRPWFEVQNWFREESWFDGRLFIKLEKNLPTSPWITFAPEIVDGRETRPPLNLSCCGCFPSSAWKEVLSNHDLKTYDQVTAAFRDGTFSDVIYASPVGDSEVGVIERLSPGGPPVRIFEDRRKLHTVIVDKMLVAPDESHLAFMLATNLKSPVPLPAIRHEVHVLDLKTGRDRRVSATYRVVGNLMWSGDSKRLYYAAVDGPVADGRGDGVFRIDFSD